jgi:hypothetical protein
MVLCNNISVKKICLKKRNLLFLFLFFCRWHKAAIAGDAESAANLGRCFLKGHGVEQSSAEAMKWLLIAAELGDVSAQCAVGIIILQCRTVTYMLQVLCIVRGSTLLKIIRKRNNGC